MRVTLIIPLFIVVLGLISCAPKVAWNKPGATQYTFDVDMRTCQYEAESNTQTTSAYGVAEAFRKQKLIKLCLQAKGYTLQRIAE